jgi:signal transduction histidine kinase
MKTRPRAQTIIAGPTGPASTRLFEELSKSGIEVIGTTTRPSAVMDMVAHSQPALLLVAMHWEMPERRDDVGWQVLCRVHAQLPQASIVLFSEVGEDDDTIITSYRFGAAAVLPDIGTNTDIPLALKASLRGKDFLNEAFAARLAMRAILSRPPVKGQASSAHAHASAGDASPEMSGPCDPQIQMMVEKERQRIRLDMHDAMGASLLIIRRYGEDLLAHVRGDGLAEDTANRLLSMVLQAYDESRSIVDGLRPRVLSDEGLVAAVGDVVGHFNTTSPQCRYELVVPQEPVALSHRVEEVAYRLVQEALANAAKYSGASHVSVRIEGEEDEHALRIVIADNGGGIAGKQSQGGGLGLIGMRDRVEALGGTITIATSSGGTSLTACF